MLRSLVGSEMCIRDSCYFGQNYTSLTVGTNGVISFDISLQGGFNDWNIPCLLYTSDAADDLLCVDLGGRRIIKKKNEQQASETITFVTEHMNNMLVSEVLVC